MSLETAVCLSTVGRCMQHTRNKQALESGIVQPRSFLDKAHIIDETQDTPSRLLEFF
jgi:hypothetical protein